MKAFVNATGKLGEINQLNQREGRLYISVVPLLRGGEAIVRESAQKVWKIAPLEKARQPKALEVHMSGAIKRGRR